MVVPAVETLLHSVPSLSAAARKALQEAGRYSTIAILLHLPRRYIDRRHLHPLAAYREHTVNSVVSVEAHSYRRLGRKRQLIVRITDQSAAAELVCFGREQIKHLLPVGRQVRLTGSFTAYRGTIQATQFEFEPDPLPGVATNQQERYSRFNKIIPLYTLPAGVSQAVYFRLMCVLLDALQRDAEQHKVEQQLRALPPAVRSYLRVPIIRALTHAHLPASERTIGRARLALARHELLVLQLKMRASASGAASARGAGAASARGALDPDAGVPDITPLLRRARVSLPFALTAGQTEALHTIYADLEQAHPMKRLLQGDVGVGKTLVALLAALPAVVAGAQVAFMVPTELLARQQTVSARRLFADSPITITLLTGSLTARERTDECARIAAGEAQLILGTHALFSKDVRFANLQMAIVDEQHRFGVEQRTALIDKGATVHQLHMTATPIPRTLALARYSGFAISTIRDQPHGRKAIITRIAAESSEQRVYNAVRSELARGHQAYFVYPLIEESERKGGSGRGGGTTGSGRGAGRGGVNARSAEQMAEYLQNEPFAEYTVACIHSRVAEDEKQQIMERFVSGAVHLLVATSVIEVGVDVPNATCIVINNAERFGLSALHQLRGRVGRSDLQSYAFLVYQDASPLSDDAKSRLKVIYQYHDGFLISEADLIIRGPGELTGTRQSGASHLKTVSFPRHLDLLQQAHNAAHVLAQSAPAGHAAPAGRAAPAGHAAPAAASPYIADVQRLFAE